jgi:hypothetical protein
MSNRISVGYDMNDPPFGWSVDSTIAPRIAREEKQLEPDRPLQGRDGVALSCTREARHRIPSRARCRCSSTSSRCSGAGGTRPARRPSVSRRPEHHLADIAVIDRWHSRTR